MTQKNSKPQRDVLGQNLGLIYSLKGVSTASVYEAGKGVEGISVGIKTARTSLAQRRSHGRLLREKLGVPVRIWGEKPKSEVLKKLRDRARSSR